ncbi:MAG: hypothetical protein U0L20_05045 [Ruminococcus sp.]|nr:hypothetical protein [Ruminococcus sp.]
MVKDSKKLTDGIIIYSVVLSDFEDLDFRNDALAGVRANYFNTNCCVQQEKTDINIDGSNYKLSYIMQNNSQLSWKVSKNQRPYQSVKRGSGDVYSVLFYSESGSIYKRAYFDTQHIWLRTEYYDVNSANRMICRLSPMYIKGIFVLQYTYFGADGKITEKVLYPSDKVPLTKCSSLVYSNAGMIWYDEKYRPSDLTVEEKLSSNIRKFTFNPQLFDNNIEVDNKLNLVDAEYITDADAMEMVQPQQNNQPVEEKAKPYSAYEKIESILFEAQKTNKDLFGEILNFASDEISADEEHDDEISEEVAVAEINTEQIEDITDIVAEQNIVQSKDVTDDTATESSASNAEVAVNDVENSESVTAEVSTAPAELEENAFVQEAEPQSNVIINNNGGKYIYYGDTDENNCRVGRGRTVSPNGTTSYDGNYKDDKRNGFGVCYYKSGEINYVGNWNMNAREGCGVGYRQSDSTMHAGRWSDNSPDGMGARFDNEGNFIDVCSYTKGVRNGLSISFDENNNLVITKWVDGEKISEKIIEVDL